MSEAPDHQPQEPPAHPNPVPLRRLPWESPDGKPCFLSTDSNGGVVSRIADAVETAQVAAGHRVLAELDDLLELPPGKLDLAQARLTLAHAREVLPDVLQVAESRAERLAAASQLKTPDTKGTGTALPQADPCP
ncbi:hypothetical protein ACIO3O_28580 [Streptomyces sp. NPDC087440]|uniref:hypothetical protein n=1 Tax=Streptomyces sp. NPDC087440 TaxID=3365790 RepID=UPI00381BB9C7